MQSPKSTYQRVLTRLRRPLFLTWAGLMAERLVRAFWPFWTVLASVTAALMLGLQDLVSVEVFWTVSVIALLALAFFLYRGFRKLHWPRRENALARMDAHLSGQPLAALADHQATGLGDKASEYLWREHQNRMADHALTAQAVSPDLRVSRFDPFGLRYIALLGLLVALFFGSLTRIGSVTDIASGPSGLAGGGPIWEGWVEPPSYTNLPALYLADQKGDLSVPQDSIVTIRFYGEVGTLSLSETVSGRTEGIEPATAMEHEFKITQPGEIRIAGPGGQDWAVLLQPDHPPQIELDPDGLDVTFDGTMSLPYQAQDDYGVTGGHAKIVLDLDAVSRRYGLTTEPDPRPDPTFDLILPVTGDRADFTDAFTENLSQHPWAHLPVRFDVTVEDALGQTGTGTPLSIPMPARRFFDPLASALIEQRRDLLWSKKNATRISQVLRAISYRPNDTLFRSETRYLRLRVILRRLETLNQNNSLTDEARDELAEALWALAVDIEEGDINDALERLREAQERLNDAMRNNASPEEIARLMQELRDATQDYLRQKSQQAKRNGDDVDEPDSQSESIELSQKDLQEMMDRIQELMEQGRMAEAQQALNEYQKMLENLQMAEGKGQGGTGEGQQAMDGLADTLREQQDLSDDAFRDFQGQSRGGQNSDPEGQQQGQNRQPGQGQTGQGQVDEGPGKEGTGNQDPNGAQGDDRSLAQRQEDLRRQLDRQRQNLPGAGTDAGDAARDALDRAGRAMDEAEKSLRDNDLAEAIDQQSEAMESMRDGMRALGEALAQEGRQGEGQTRQTSRSGPEGAPDPLGRTPGNNGAPMGSDQHMLQGEDVYRRAQDLLDEIRRRSGDRLRPDAERDYLRRLLDRF